MSARNGRRVDTTTLPKQRASTQGDVLALGPGKNRSASWILQRSGNENSMTRVLFRRPRESRGAGARQSKGCSERFLASAVRPSHKPVRVTHTIPAIFAVADFPAVNSINRVRHLHLLMRSDLGRGRDGSTSQVS